MQHNILEGENFDGFGELREPGIAKIFLFSIFLPKSQYISR